MGTGQGAKTTGFLSQVNFYSTSKTDLVAKFSAALERNAGLALGNWGSISEKTIPGWTVVSDAQIWGQASNHLKVDPTVNGRVLTLDEKFSQYWDDKVVNRWKVWKARPIEERTWASLLAMITGLGIPGFSSGLTGFQLANNAAILGLAQQPTIAEVADWVWDNQGLGAYAGLTLLGFSLATCGEVRCAMECVARHLDTHLTKSDKEDLGFNAIFVEHLLCKITRWHGRMGKSASGEPLLDQLAKGAERDQEEVPWIAGENMTVSSRLPFPVLVQSSAIHEVVNGYNVSTLA
ncbi:hypothetical protein BKA70DRAFT_1109693 [Coprinopsis sp. MPI-PUGE-AT-0042]|nr:hypothetical protein BKA70DRAFT_1109693 [Coprinopsis sp. MPI-PUGE-AT-0042]